MAYFNQIDHFEPALPKVHQEIYEPARVECERLICAAVVSKRFLNGLLTNPVKTIEEGFYGEKFTFTGDVKQNIKHIHAKSLADFSVQLMQIIEFSPSVAPAPEMAYVR